MRNVLLLGLLTWCWLAAGQTLSPEVKKIVKVAAPVIVLEHVRVIDGTAAQRAKIR